MARAGGLSRGARRWNSSLHDSSSSAGRRSSIDEIIELYKRDVDRTLLRENLKKTPTERVRALQERLAEEAQRAGREARKKRG